MVGQRCGSCHIAIGSKCVCGREADAAILNVHGPTGSEGSDVTPDITSGPDVPAGVRAHGSPRDRCACAIHHMLKHG